MSSHALSMAFVSAGLASLAAMSVMVLVALTRSSVRKRYLLSLLDGLDRLLLKEITRSPSARTDRSGT